MDRFDPDPVTLSDFVGTYVVRQGSQSDAEPVVIGPGYEVEIAVWGAGEARITIRDGDTVTSEEVYAFAQQTLRTVTTDDDGVVHHRQLSLLKLSGEPSPYRSIYGVDVHGDPENVGTWGADDGPGSG